MSLAALDDATPIVGARRNDDVALVVVSETDRGAEKFGYPIRPERLLDLLSAIDLAGAAVIGVDFLTEDERAYASVQEPDLKALTVWVYRASPDSVLELRRPLGNRGLLHGRSGLSFTVPDADDRLRRYRPVEGSGDQALVTFPRAIAKAWCETERRELSDVRTSPVTPCEPKTADDKEHVILPADPPSTQTVDAWSLLNAYRSRQSQPDEWLRLAAVLHGRVVILGGEQRRDVHPVADGAADGVLVQYRMVHAELDGAFLRDAPKWMKLTVKAAVAFFILFAYLAWSPAIAGGVVVLVAAATIVGGARLSQIGGYWLNPIPLAVGVLLEMLVESHFGHPLSHWIDRLWRRLRQAKAG